MRSSPPPRRCMAPTARPVRHTEQWLTCGSFVVADTYSSDTWRLATVRLRVRPDCPDCGRWQVRARYCRGPRTVRDRRSQLPKLARSVWNWQEPWSATQARACRNSPASPSGSHWQVQLYTARERPGLDCKTKKRRVRQLLAQSPTLKFKKRKSTPALTAAHKLARLAWTIKRQT